MRRPGGEYLRGGIVQGAAEGLQLVRLPREPEVGELDVDPVMTPVLDQDVLGLDIPVDDGGASCRGGM